MEAIWKIEVEDFPAGADPTGRTFSAGLVDREFQEELCDIDHTVVLVHDDQSARTHHRTDRDQRIVIHRRIDQRSRDSGRNYFSGRLDSLQETAQAIQV